MSESTANKSPAFHQLSVHQIKVLARIGCTEKERATPQEVRIDVSLRFEDFPRAAHTDKLEDTVCYAQITDTVQDYFQSNEVNLIEKAGYDCFTRLKEITPRNTGIQVRIHKVQPPVASIKGGSLFVCGDF